jgi:hypothetical protein
MTTHAADLPSCNLLQESLTNFDQPYDPIQLGRMADQEA